MSFDSYLFMKQILCALILVFNIYLSLLLQAQNLPCKTLPKNLTVTLNYWQQINGFFAYNEKLPNECKIKNTRNKRIIICPAWVKILINKKQLLSWQQQQKTGFINLYLPKIGILHEKAKITKIIKVTQQEPTNKNQHLITAFYMRYAHVLKYKIKNTNMGKLGVIITTPEHKFYEATYHKFISISELGPDNTIINALNHYFKIICTNNRHHHCGTTPLNSLEKVYNMEVEKAHNYFVDNMKILVHNGCYDEYFKCRLCDESHVERNYFSKECHQTADRKHDFKKLYQCEFCGRAHAQKKIITDHKISHKKECSNKYLCAVCSGKFKSPAALANHENMHIRNKNTIFCGECDEFISLIEKLDKEHGHNVYGQPKNITGIPLRAKSRSPIRDFLKNIDTAELPDFSNLDLPDLSSYEN